MSSWQRFWRQTPQLSDAQAQRLARWREKAPTPANLELDHARFVVLDTETSGLNQRSDTLLSIAAVSVRHGVAELSEVFDCVLRQRAPSANENIVIHGISGGEQLAGTPPAEALLAFLDYAGKDPLLAFHADFDRTFIDKALRRYLGCVSAGPWLDVAEILPALFPSQAAAQFDDWLVHFGITPAQRHSALGDAAACAELLLIMLSRAQTQDIRDLRSLRRRVAPGHWLAR